jgi:hypothetical protein
MSQSCTQCAVSQCIPSSTLNNLAGNTTAKPVKSNTGVIAGGIGGALVLLLIVVGVIFYWRRKKKVQAEELDAWLSTTESLNEKSLRGSTSTRGTVISTVCSCVLMVGCELVTPFYCGDYDDKGFEYHPDRISTIPSSKHNDVCQHSGFQPLRGPSRLNEHYPLPSTHSILLRRRYPSRQ